MPSLEPPGAERQRGTGAARRGARGRHDATATRRALLQAAAVLFSERGFDGVPIEDLAARAGVNKALISYHFGGKRGLYAAVLESQFAAMAERLQAIEASARDARHALRGVLEHFQRVGRDQPGFPALFLREVLASGIEPAVVPQLARIVAVSRRLAERGAREGLFRRVDPMLLHFGLVGSLVFFFATEPARRRAAARGEIPFPMPDAKAFVRYLEELTLRGLAPGKPMLAHPRGLAPGKPMLAHPRGLAPGKPKLAHPRGLAPGKPKLAHPRGLARARPSARPRPKGANA